MLIAGVAIPGYICSIIFIDRIGHKNLQLFGFMAMATCFILSSLKTITLGLGPFVGVVLFALTFFFSNFGPNTTTYVIPATCYPTLVRATCHGLSAAAGKIGAVIGAAGFSPIYDAYGLPFVLQLCSLVCLSGALVTYFFTGSGK